MKKTGADIEGWESFTHGKEFDVRKLKDKCQRTIKDILADGREKFSITIFSDQKIFSFNKIFKKICEAIFFAILAKYSW